MTVAESIFTKLSLAGQRTAQATYTVFHENPTKSFVTDTLSQIAQMGGRIFFFLICEDLTLFIHPPQPPPTSNVFHVQNGGPIPVLRVPISHPSARIDTCRSNSH